MKYELYHGNCLEVLPALGFFECLVADPPDAIGLSYNQFHDDMSEHEYRDFLWSCLNAFVQHAGVSWISFNAKWTFMMGSLVERLTAVHKTVEAKPFVQTFTFGQNRTTDCGNGHRPLLRLRHANAPLYPEQIKVASWRELNGDKRAAKGGRVPLDHWHEFPRVTGNSRQRRPYHPTQLHEGLVERCITMSTREGGRVLDVFSGTGTAMRVCRRINRHCTSVEIDSFYCDKIAEEHGIEVFHERVAKT